METIINTIPRHRADMVGITGNTSSGTTRLPVAMGGLEASTTTGTKGNEKVVVHIDCRCIGYIQPGNFGMRRDDRDGFH